MPTPEISVVIPAFDEEHYLPHCLDALQRQVKAPPYEIIVVDNGSDDATAEIARGYGLRVVTEPLKGVARARRAGFAAAQAPIIASTDADCAPAPDWLARIGQAFRSEPDLIAVGGYALPMDGPRYVQVIPRVSQRLNALHYMGMLLGHQPLSTQNLAVRRDAYEKAGGFNPEIVSPLALDDVDLTLRLSGIGRVRVLPDLIVWASARRYMQEPVKTMGYRLANYTAYALRGHGVFANRQSNVRL